MTMNPNQPRAQKYFQLSSQLAQMDNTQLSALLDNSPHEVGWGRHQTVEIEGAKLFVKRLPLTELEQQNSFSTQNLYNLPIYYHYGVGSAGFGVFRELVTHIKTTNWVLQGEIENFPLLYHYRTMPFSGERTALDREEHQQYVKYWGGNEQVGQYMLDRANATAEMVLFLEHIPHPLQPWLLAHLDQVYWVLDDLRTTVDFLHKNGIIHFDAYFDNILTDGAHVYLTDFGLALDQNFALHADEIAFFNAHTNYDYGHFISELIFPVYDLYEALPAQAKHEVRAKYGVVEEENQFYKVLFILLEHVEEMQASGVIQVNETYLAHLVRYRSIVVLMRNFFSEMRRNHQKDTPFPYEELQRLLKETGLISDKHIQS